VENSLLRRWFGGAQADAAPAFDLEFAFASDPGCQRAVNEDSVCCQQPVGARHGFLALVADGMGGHAAGAEASGIAVRVVPETYYDGRGTPQAALTRAFHAANRSIHDRSREPGRRGMGTTCTALSIAGGNAYCAHVGDSRLYLVRQGEIHQLTEDHSRAAELVRQGVLTADQVRNHSERNVIYRALGRELDLAVAVWREPMPLRPGDCFVLSSDGLHDLVPDSAILDAVLFADPRPACDRLIGEARAAGGFDNITVIVVRVLRRSGPVTPDILSSRG
jgi:PPM family protein phosphatase